jgi:hypothetical protein
MPKKTCSKCGEDKDVKEFNKFSRSKDMLQSYCRQCSRAYSKNNYAAKKQRNTSTT